MLKINPKEISIPKLHQYILGCVAPRPIAFASTVNKNGNPNLAPFSFFNAIGSNPPILIFSPARSGRDNTTKNTLDNIEETKEVVINIVHYGIVQQVSLASSPYPKGVNEFIKSGLTPINSELVKPYRVKESPAHFECKVLDIIKTGNLGSAGNIVICEIVLMHISEDVLDAEGKISPYKFDQVARMGSEYYCRVIPESIFILPQPKTECGIGVDALPPSIRNSKILTGNNLGQLGHFLNVPTKQEAAELLKDEKIMTEIKMFINDETKFHTFIKNKLDANQAWNAFKIIMLKEYHLI